MLTPVPPTECMRARESVSAQLDGELAELETLRLDFHLRECPACAAWAQHVRAATTRLRQAPLELPSVSVELPGPARRRTGALALAGAAAMAAAAAAAIIGTLTPASDIRTPTSALHVGPTGRQSILDSHILSLENQLFAPSTLRSGNVYAT
jgi:predicted anti-sigma-YlaC factor YlaD